VTRSDANRAQQGLNGKVGLTHFIQELRQENGRTRTTWAQIDRDLKS
jgi:hypothetical protein